jgi:hypothetical protein
MAFVLLQLIGRKQDQLFRVLWKILELKRDEVTGEWRKLHNEELHVLYSSPSTIGTIKLRRMRWAGHLLHSNTTIPGRF